MHDFFRERPIRRRSSLFEKMQIRQARIDLLGNRRAVTQRSDPQFRIEQRAPSIVALLNQGSSTNRQIVARTNSNASSLPQLYKTAPANIQKVETQMTKTDSIVNIADLINKCSDVMPSVLFCKGYKMTTQSNEDVTRQLGDLQKILNFVQQPGGLHKIGPRNLNSFLSMIQSHIFHPLPEVEHKFTFCDVVPTITVLDWPVIDTCYSIFLTVLKSLDGQILASLINQKFLMNLIAMLKSPDKREQNAVANLTFSIIEFNPRLTSTAIDEDLVFCHLNFIVIAILASNKGGHEHVGHVALLALSTNHFWALRAFHESLPALNHMLPISLSERADLCC